MKIIPGLNIFSEIQLAHFGQVGDLAARNCSIYDNCDELILENDELSREIHIFTFCQVLLLIISIICCLIGKLKLQTLCILDGYYHRFTTGKPSKIQTVLMNHHDAS